MSGVYKRARKAATLRISPSASGRTRCDRLKEARRPPLNLAELDRLPLNPTSVSELSIMRPSRRVSSSSICETLIPALPESPIPAVSRVR